MSGLSKRYSTVTIDEITETGSGDARAVSSWTTISGNHQGFIQPVSGNENFRKGKSGELVTTRMYCPVDTPGVYGNRVTQNSVSYMMLYTIQTTGISSVGHHKEILLGDFQ